MPWRKIIVGIVLFLIMGIVLGACTMDRWLFKALDPGAFDPQKTPKAPDYASASSWAALPSLKDGADIALPSHPATKRPRADVFYLHPTTALGPAWNMPIDTPEVIKATHRGATLIQASAFNGCCRIFAPRYRQANGRTMIHPDTHGQKALNIAYSDVKRAFRHFIKHQNKGRPFLLASHSQGTVMAARLLRNEIAGKPLQKRLVVAYLIGGPLHQADLNPKVPICQNATQTGCAVGFNARGPKYKAGRLEFANQRAHARTMKGWLCVNPLTWRQDTSQAPKTHHMGALFFDTETPRILKQFAAAQCKDGRLLVTKPGKFPPRDVMSRILLWVMGPQNYHPIEYQLFYMNLRQNAIQRVQAYLKKP